MKEILQKFFKKKINILLLVLQSLALVSFVMIEYLAIFSYLFVLFESAFFVVWGIGTLKSNKEIYKTKSMYEKLPYSSIEKADMQKKTETEIKNNKFKGVMLVLLGVVLFFTFMSFVL